MPKFIMFKLLILFPLFLHATEDLEVVFARANQAFQKQEYTLAISEYEKCLEKGHSFNIYYNLSRSYAKLGERGKAFLNYQKAFMLEPRSKLLKPLFLNLKIDKSMNMDPSILEELAFINNAHTWNYLNTFFFWLSSIFIIIHFFYKKKNLFCFFIISILGFFISALGLYGWHSYAKNGVLLKDHYLLLAPAASSPTLDLLHSGQLAKKIKANSDYYYIKINEKTGWVPKQYFILITE